MSKGDIDGFLKALFQREAGKNTQVINYAGYIGKYQFGESALVDLGYYTADGTKENDWAGKWTGKHGVKQRSDFLGSEQAQDVAAKEWVELLCKRMKKMKLDAYIGKTIKGIKITESGIIAGAHLKGFGNDKHPGVAQFLRSNGAIDAQDGLKTCVSHYVELLADYDLGCCNKLNVAFAEKKTGAPIPGLDVLVQKNGKPHASAKTDDNGVLPAVHGFSAGDQYQIFVAKLSGGYKLLKAGVMRDVDATLAFLSPKAKTTTSTDEHKGPPAEKKAPPAPAAPKPAAAPAPAPASAGEKPKERPEFTSIKPIEPDQLDKNSALWDRLQTLPPVAVTPSSAPSETSAAEPAPVAPAEAAAPAADSAPQTPAQPAEVKAPETMPSAGLSPFAPAQVPAASPASSATPPPAPAPAAPVPAAKPPAAKSAGAKATVEAEKTRSESGHPKAVAKKTPPPPPPPPPATKMQKTIPGLLFPFEKRPEQSYHDGARQFGSSRSGGTRRHAGIDLYAPVGTPVRAMADGVVLQVYAFYEGTWVIEVDHGTFIARYGEVSKKGIAVKALDDVKRGQNLGTVGKLNNLDISMLHLELYGTNADPTEKGKALTQKTRQPFQRRDDLINPTASIDLAVLE
ncbi:MULTISPECIES: M23 family metallopeptidase [unclassified Duganella]|uniref:M23 family metallopeptidase n=1 Tax=unclassified Duganella TaxID=2636909 RepID=UPI000E352806|nr:MULTISPECIES: M23 family metallopeptidase [unclassified Duganella]RFP08417.1 M23 family peptidase [Duganella sp. BJB475]RFP22612.1 M23 family peptidase [Duganella sp. BJB476]